MRLLGFLNFYGEFPAPLLSVVETVPGAALIVIFPDGNTRALSLEETEQTLLEHNGYVPPGAHVGLDPALYVFFAITPEKVLAIDSSKIVQTLALELPNLDERQRRVVLDYIADANQSVVRVATSL